MCINTNRRPRGFQKPSGFGLARSAIILAALAISCASASEKGEKRSENEPPRNVMMLPDSLLAVTLSMVYTRHDADLARLVEASDEIRRAVNNFTEEFVTKPGLWVKDAGHTEANGWYDLRKASEGPPRCGRQACMFQPNRTEYWKILTESKPYFEKENGYCIWWDSNLEEWRLQHSRKLRYVVESSADLPVPPTDGWTYPSWSDPTDGPPPTIQLQNVRRRLTDAALKIMTPLTGGCPILTAMRRVDNCSGAPASPSLTSRSASQDLFRP